MFAALKALLQRLPLPWRRPAVEQYAAKTSEALRQLNRRYLRQKRLWVYCFLYSLSLLVIYVIFAIFLPGLWEYVIPIAWIVLAGIVIAILQIRRCNEVCRILRQTYAVQVQIEKAEAEKEEQEKEEAEDAQIDPSASTNGSQRPPDFPDIREQ